MAAFPTGEAALRAATEGLQAVQQTCVNPHTQQPLQIRIGVHKGSALMVPVNGINDYFGQTVNIAARIESAAAASQCLVSSAALEDEETRKTFEDLAASPAFYATDDCDFQAKGVAQSLTVRGLTLVGAQGAAGDA